MSDVNEPEAVTNEPVATATDAGPSTTMQVTWDDSDMASTYANVCNILGTREEIMLLFGSNHTWNLDQNEVNVALSNRVVVNPYAAKRLLNMLQIGLREYETRYGELKL